jgi:hypothetical protein
LLSQKKGYIERLFKTSENSADSGAYLISLNVSGIWTEFMVDDYLPFWIASNPDQKSSREVTSLIGCGHVWDILTPVFNKTPILGLKDKNQTVAIWPVILEKALVKSLGGYHKLLNSDTSTLEYLKDFTSSPGLSIDITHPKFE